MNFRMALARQADALAERAVFRDKLLGGGGALRELAESLTFAKGGAGTAALRPHGCNT